jgi:hypothetical protein
MQIIYWIIWMKKNVSGVFSVWLPVKKVE